MKVKNVVKSMLGAVALAAVVAGAAVSMNASSKSVDNHEIEACVEYCVHTHASGKHCTYTVGCSCSGFSPITSGKEYEKAYCKKCGHHRSYHK